MKFLGFTLLLFASVFALPSNHERRIWNGNPARPGQAPFLIGILWFEEDTTVQPLNICGGAIVNRWWVITVSVVFIHKFYHYYQGKFTFIGCALS